MRGSTYCGELLAWLKSVVMESVQVNNDVKKHHLDKHQWYIHDNLCEGICCGSIERAIQVRSLACLAKAFAYKLLCFINMGRLSNAAVSSASASRALNRRIKKITPPRVKTPELDTFII